MTFERFEGRKDVGSSRIRAQWVINHWPDAEIFVQGKEYDVVIYQKAYWVEHAKLFKGVKILDICDPDFLHWGYRTKEMIEEVDAITCPTEALAVVFRQFTDKPVYVVPDRVDMDALKKKKVHVGDAKRVVWFGYSTGFDMLGQAVYFLGKQGLDLLVVSDKPYTAQTGTKINVENIRWKEDTAFDNILLGDVMINPQSGKNKWRFKSNNKTLTAWALGLPVATNTEELEKFVTESARKEEVALRLKEIDEKWKVEYSVEDYKRIIEEIIKAKV